MKKRTLKTPNAKQSIQQIYEIIKGIGKGETWQFLVLLIKCIILAQKNLF